MPDESRTPIIDPIAPALKAIHDELAAFRLETHGRLSKIEGLVEGFKLALDQMDRRMSTVQWMMGVLAATQIFVLGRLFLK